VSNVAGGSGLALIELYDTDAASPSAGFARLVNISGRARVGTGNDVLIAGFVISGDGTKRLLVRATGPGLQKLGVGDFLADPELSIYRGAERIAVNDNWNPTDAATFSLVGAFGFESGSKDASLVLDLPPGGYTAVIRGIKSSTGTALIEVYEVP
jgi:hypothetical protein